MSRETVGSASTPERPKFENTPEYRGRCRAYFQPRGANEPGPMVTLIDGRRGQVTEYRSNLQSESYRFNPEIHIQIEGEERPGIFSLQDIEGWQGEYGSNLTREKKD